MSDEKEPTVLACSRVADIETPKAHSVIDHCDGCGWSVWRALSSPPADRILCGHCAMVEIAKARTEGETVTYGGPTAEQLADIERWLEDDA